MSTVVNMGNVSAQDITQAIKTELEQQGTSAIKNDKSGTFAVSDNTKTNQEFKIGDTTIKNIGQAVKMSLDTLIKQRDAGDQIIDTVDVIAPCLAKGEHIPMSNASYISMVATDVANNATKAVMDSEEVKKFITKQEGSTDVKSKDFVQQFGDMVGTVVGSLTAFGISGMVVYGIIIVAVILFIPLTIKFLGGGKGVASIAKVAQKGLHSAKKHGKSKKRGRGG